MTLPVIDLTGPKGRIIDAALALATERPWREVALRDIADRAGFGLVDMREHFASKADVLAAFARAVDDAVLVAAPAAGSAEPKRDQLFEIVMARFDAMRPYRTALQSIFEDTSVDGALIRSLMASQAWMLEGAGISTDGIEGGVRVAGLATVYASVFRTWLADDDPGLARTMAALDRRLRRGERTLSALDDMGKAARGIVNRLGAILAGRSTTMEQSIRETPPAPDETADEAPRHV